MAGVQDGQLVRVGGFTAGLNNRASDFGAPVTEGGTQNALREAVNVSLTLSGEPVRRPGQTLRVAGAAHSLYAMREHLIAAVDGEMAAYRQGQDGTLTKDVVIGNVGSRFCTFATDDFSTWWSNGIVGGRIAEDLTAHPFWIDTPEPPSVTVSGGALDAGSYEVSVTAVDADGRESGASGGIAVTCGNNGGFSVTLRALPVGTAKWRLYVSAPNGEVLYQQGEYPVNVLSASVGNLAPSAALETQWLHPLLPCQVLRYGHSRLYGLAGNVLIWSEEYRLGLMHPDNHIVLGAEATLLEPLGDGESSGVWVADHKRTYFLSGADPNNWQQIARYPHAAVPGTSTTLPGTYFGLETTDLVAYWMAANGTPCIGLSTGQLIPLREDALALPAHAERGATGLMLFDGIRQLLTTTIGAGANLAQASDRIDATVTRRNHGQH